MWFLKAADVSVKSLLDFSGSSEPRSEPGLDLTLANMLEVGFLSEGAFGASVLDGDGLRTGSEIQR